jgi:P-type E1-E2 ATPase
MLSGGQALESYAVRSASSALAALARRMPSTVHRRRDGQLEEIPLDHANVGDLLVVFPHETCPVDGVVVEGRSEMNEAYLTGEPYMLSKIVGSAVSCRAPSTARARSRSAPRNGPSIPATRRSCK